MVAWQGLLAPRATPAALIRILDITVRSVGNCALSTTHSKQHQPLACRARERRPSDALDTREVTLMCRSIKTLFNFEPPVTDEEIRASALQFVRKVSGFTHPSKTNEAAFHAAVDEITMASRRLLSSLETSAAPKDRDQEAAKARARAALRFPT